MERAWKLWEEGNNNVIAHYGDPDLMRLYVVNILGELKTPQSVKVLGGFLSDTRHMLDPRLYDVGIPTANAYLSQQALIRLLDDPPTFDEELFARAENLRTWQLWFEQVKAGTRTFRFKGDPQPYTLTGPAERELRPGQGLAGVEERNLRRVPGVAEEERAEEQPDEKPLWWVGLVAGTGILLIAIWRMVGRGKSHG
ncbi:hypothetical protein Hsar01_02438 [Haloferula sargassicola]|uniref:Uncharacterized protein n=2 Tax=Haloferula sargassicola TaxID=490096 RepID=A0ABP9UT53_9BACT